MKLIEVVREKVSQMNENVPVDVLAYIENNRLMKSSGNIVGEKDDVVFLQTRSELLELSADDIAYIIFPEGE